jgi:hypothetical protein
MKSMRQWWFCCLVILALALISACGGDSGGDGSWCPGVVCSNCAGDCLDIELDCAQGQSEACVGGAYFDADENLRCTFCLEE